MKELNRTRRLIIASILFVLIIFVGLLTFRNPAFEYKISTTAMINELNDPNNILTPEEALEMIDNNHNTSVFIDLRNPYEYNKGFLGEAINIPVSDILDDESLAFFQQMQNDSIEVILYSYNQREANAQWMLLEQLGFNNMKVLLGGYEYLAYNDNDFSDLPEIPTYRVEEPAIKFIDFFNKTGEGDMSSEKTMQEPVAVQPVKRKKKTTSAGGC